jgi:hypothetical protein
LEVLVFFTCWLSTGLVPAEGNKCREHAAAADRVEVGIAPECIVPDSAVKLPAYAFTPGQKVGKPGILRECHIGIMEFVTPEMAGADGVAATALPLDVTHHSPGWHDR